MGEHTSLLITLQDPFIGSYLDLDFFHFTQESASGTREGSTTFGMNSADRFSHPLNFKKECKEGEKKSLLYWGLNYISEITADSSVLAMYQASCKVFCTYCYLILISLYVHNRLMK